MSAGDAVGHNFNQGTTTYVAPDGGTAIQTVEAQVQGVVGASLNHIDMQTISSINSLNVSWTLQFRKNGANATSAITVAAGNTGQFSDTADTDTMVAGDLINHSISAPAGAGSANFKHIASYITDSNMSASGVMYGGSAVLLSGGSNFWPTQQLAGNTNNTATEANSEIPLYMAATLSYLYVYLSSNTANQAMTLTVRKNGANGNGTVTMASSATGSFNDTTDTDTYANGDTTNTHTTTTANSGTVVARMVGVTYSNTATADSPAYGGQGDAGAAFNNVLQYATTKGGAGTDNPDPTVETEAFSSFTISKMLVFTSSNTNTTTVPMTFRKNAANGNEALTIAGGATGLTKDSTHTDSLANTDQYNYQLDNSAAAGVTITLTFWGVTMTPPGTPIPPPSTGPTSTQTLIAGRNARLNLYSPAFVPPRRRLPHHLAWRDRT